MRKLLSVKFLFLVNAVIELLGGIVVLLYPNVLLLGSTPTTETAAISKMYSLSILLIGIVSFQCYKYFDKEIKLFKIIFLAIATYHLLIGFQLYGYYMIEIINNLGLLVLHLSLAGLFVMVYFKEM